MKAENFFKAISEKVTFVKKLLQKGNRRADTFNPQRIRADGSKPKHNWL